MNCAWKELLGVLPPWLKEQLEPDMGLQEIRLRLGQPVGLLTARGMSHIGRNVGASDLEYVVNMACRFSPWTAASAAQGYLTVRGGHRIGLCGQALVRAGKMTGLGKLTSLNIRVCGDFPGISRDLGDRRESILLIGPPGSGKTTLLRDLIRSRSHRENVAVVDQRGEIFPPEAAFPQGENTDVVTGCTKAQGVDMLLRVMGPQCIALDEITAAEDCRALIQAGKCGVALLATAHAAGVEDLEARPVYRTLLESGLFDTAVVLQMDKSWRTERMRR